MSAAPIPYRFQYQRAKGYRAPDNRKSVKRPTHGRNSGKWGNPFMVADMPSETLEAKHAAAVAAFEQWLINTSEGQQMASDARRELRGLNLGCTCPLDLPCHGNTLLRIANETDATE